MSLCASELEKHMQIETSMDEITEEVNIWSWESIGNWLGIRWESSEERSVWTVEQKSIWRSVVFWNGVLGHLERYEEAFITCMRICPKSINEALKGLYEVGIWSVAWWQKRDFCIE